MMSCCTQGVSQSEAIESILDYLTTQQVSPLIDYTP